MASKTKKKSITVKGVSLTGLTPRQQTAMKKHSKHHTESILET